jgi:hypothetical protein
VDLKGVFAPDMNSVLLKTDVEHWNNDTNKSNTKNSADDVDCQLFSVYKFFQLLSKGETGAVDLLFSMFREDTTLYVDEEFKKFVLENYTKLVPKNMKAFVGYAMGQAKRFSVKGERFNELVHLTDYLKTMTKDGILRDRVEELTDLVKEYKYCTFETLNTTRDGTSHGLYLTVLGRSFLETNKFEYVVDRLCEIRESYGKRSEAAAGGFDSKAMSHALRVMLEAKELLETGMVKFPLVYAEEVKAVKYSEFDKDSEEMSALVLRLELLLQEVDEAMETSCLPDKVDQTVVNEFILKTLKEMHEF